MRTLCNAVGIALAIAPAVLAADLTLGTPAEGALTAEDLQNPDGKFEDIYNLALEAGQTVIVTCQGQGIDTMLIVTAPDGTATIDDDSAGNLNPRVVISSSQSGVYKVTVTTFSAGATGRYRLTAETGEQRRLALGEPADVELTGLPLTLSLPLEAGQAVQIAATNCTFDASLTAVGPGLPQVFADDYTGRREPRLHLIAPQTGTVSVIVNSWSDPRGRATITATLLTPDTRIDYAGGAPSVTPLTLAPGAECLRVSVAAPAGTRLALSADSREFLTRLAVLVPPPSLAPEATGLVNRARLEVPASGEFLLEILPQTAGQGGALELVVFDLGPGRLPSFTLPDLSGQPVTSESLLGQALIIHLFATWSQTLGEETAMLDAVAAEFGGQVRVAGIGQGETLLALREAQERHAIAHTVLVDETSLTPSLFGEQTGSGIAVYAPVVAVVAPDGRITAMHTASLPTREQLTADVAEALGAQP